MTLPPDYKTRLDNLNKGYEGEQRFFTLIKNRLMSDCTPLYDLLLKGNQTEFQIDNLLIFNSKIHLIEVKNYEGDFFIKDEKWYAVASRNEIRNPLLQLERSDFLFRQLLQELGYNLSVKSYLVFINKEFTLYQAAFNQSLILPTPLKRFMMQLNTISSTITKRHKKLAEQLAHRHIESSSHERLPTYEYDQLQKGVTCPSCFGFMSEFNKIKLRCKSCGAEERIETAVMRSIVEFNLLFPNSRITTGAI